jgi:hypothetical protein
MSLGFMRAALLSSVLTVAPGFAAAAPDLIWPVCDVSRLTRLPEKGLPPPQTQDAPSDSVWWKDPATKIYLEFGTPVFAAGDGRVLAVERIGPFGNVIDIEHAHEVFTRYGHLQSVRVRPGDHVVQGQKIASVGSSGRSARPGLYLAVHNNRLLFAPEVVMRRPTCKGGVVLAPQPALRGSLRE